MPRGLPSSVGRRALPPSLSRGGTTLDDGLEQPATQSSVVPPRQHPSATDTGRPAAKMERAQATRAADAVDPAVERERLVRVAAIHLHPDLAHSWGTGSASDAGCAQVELKKQAKERQQAELAELKRVEARQEAAWVNFEQERQAKAEVENAAKAASRAEASAKRRLAMISGKEPKGDAPVDNLKKLMDGKGSKRQKAGAKGKGGSARSKCLRSQQPMRSPTAPESRPLA